MNRPYPYYELPHIDNMREMVQLKVETQPNDIAFSWLEKEDAVQKTYQQFADEVRRLGAWFLRRGFCNGTHIGILGGNSYVWLLLFMAIVNSGNVAVVLDKDMSEDELADVLIRMDVEALFVEKMPDSDKMHYFDGDRYDFDTVNELLNDNQVIEKDAFLYDGLSLDSNATSCIFLTSGTTGRRKGVMLSHRNIVADVNGSCKLFELKGDVLAVLPFHHAFGLIVAVWMVFHYGHTVYISKGYRHLQREFSLTKPQTMMLVPLFVETFYKQIWSTAKKDGRVRQLRQIKKLSDVLHHIHIDVRRKLFREVLAAFGGNLEYIICGGAALDEMYVKEFRSFGIEVLNGYGTTECAPVAAVNRNHFHRDGTVGLPLPNSQIRIADDGEVLIQGDHIMQGYYGEEAATEEVLIGKWYHTGDLGSVDQDGFLTLTGRKKNLIILSTGENVSPEELEQRLRRIDGIDEVVVSAEGNQLTGEIFVQGRQENTDTEERIKQGIQRLNRTLPMYKRIAKIYFRNRPFDKTTTQKIKRSE